MSFVLHSLAISTTLSGVRGAKQDVVLKMQRILAGVTLSIVAAIASISVTSYSPSITGWITNGFRLAVKMLLRQVFWSILGQTTYSASGFKLLRASRLRVMDIPVAKGKTMQSLMHERPQTFLRTFRVIALVNLTMSDEPTAFGCRALTSPLLPIP